MRSPVPDRLHLGCGLVAPPGWLNVDGSWQAALARYPRLRRLLGQAGLLPRRQAEIPWPSNVRRLDLRRRLPFEDAYFEAVYSSHLLEHLYRGDALRLLRECRRVLRPGGVCRAVVPDLAPLVDVYFTDRLRSDVDAARELLRALQMRPEEEGGAGLYRVYRRLTDFHTHKWMYDERALISLFEEAGFRRAERRPMWESDISAIREVELEGRAAPGVGVCVEARRAES